MVVIYQHPQNPSSQWGLVSLFVGVVLSGTMGCVTRSTYFHGVVTTGETATHSFDTSENVRDEPPLANARVRLTSHAELEIDPDYCPPTTRRADEAPTYVVDVTDGRGHFEVGIADSPFSSVHWVVLCVDAPGHERYRYRVETISTSDPTHGEEYLNIRLRRTPP